MGLGGVGDLLDGDAIEAALGEQLGCGVADDVPAAGLGAVFGFGGLTR